MKEGTGRAGERRAGERQTCRLLYFMLYFAPLSPHILSLSLSLSLARSLPLVVTVTVTHPPNLPTHPSTPTTHPHTNNHQHVGRRRLFDDASLILDQSTHWPPPPHSHRNSRWRRRRALLGGLAGLLLASQPGPQRRQDKGQSNGNCTETRHM